MAQPNSRLASAGRPGFHVCFIFLIDGRPGYAYTACQAKGVFENMKSWYSFSSSVLQLGVTPDDSAETRLNKKLLIVSVLLILPAGLIWGGLYLLFGEVAAGSLPLLYCALSLLNLIFFSLTRR
jgi:hypothetical protein